MDYIANSLKSVILMANSGHSDVWSVLFAGVYFIFIIPIVITTFFTVYGIDKNRYNEKRKFMLIKHFNFLFIRYDKEKKDIIAVETFVYYVCAYVQAIISVILFILYKIIENATARAIVLSICGLSMIIFFVYLRIRDAVTNRGYKRK